MAAMQAEEGTVNLDNQLPALMFSAHVDDEDDVMLPDGPPPGQEESSSSSDSDDIPMPEGPPPLPPGPPPGVKPECACIPSICRILSDSSSPRHASPADASLSTATSSYIVLPAALT
jgi:hypothetical protein